MTQGDTTRLREDRLRRALRKEGMLLRKSRVRTPNPDDLGGYCVLTLNNAVAVGGTFDLDLGEVEQWFEQWGARPVES